MRSLLPVVLMLIGAATALPGRAAEGGAPPRVEKFTPAQAAQYAGAAERARARAALSIFVTDDADAMRLPAFATRTTPLPVRFLRVGVEWTF